MSCLVYDLVSLADAVAIGFGFAAGVAAIVQIVSHFNAPGEPVFGVGFRSLASCPDVLSQ